MKGQGKTPLWKWMDASQMMEVYSYHGSCTLTQTCIFMRAAVTKALQLSSLFIPCSFRRLSCVNAFKCRPPRRCEQGVGYSKVQTYDPSRPPRAQGPHLVLSPAGWQATPFRRLFSSMWICCIQPSNISVAKVSERTPAQFSAQHTIMGVGWTNPIETNTRVLFERENTRCV
jgi:hypothetical protein